MHDDWSGSRSNGPLSLGVAGMGALRLTLLFGSAAVALALILTPMAERHLSDELIATGGHLSRHRFHDHKLDAIFVAPIPSTAACSRLRPIRSASSAPTGCAAATADELPPRR